MKTFLRFAFTLLLTPLFFTLFLAPKAAAQHPVVFEAFQNDGGSMNNNCPVPTLFQTQLSSIGTTDYSKVIYLEYHDADPLANPYTGQIGNSLEPASGGSFYSYFGAVNRLNPEFGVELHSGGTYTENSSFPGDIQNQINAGYNNPPPTSITLSNATLDKTIPSSYNFAATVSVTATARITDSIYIHYAILEDEVVDAHMCGKATTHNGVVRYITVGDSLVFLPQTASGTVATVSFQQDGINAYPQEPTNMRFVVFLEDPSEGIIDAAQLIQDLDTLSSPPPTLSLISSNLDGQIFRPDSTVTISFAATNLPNGANVLYSTNNGKSWITIATGQSGFFFWTVPDTLTTQGKIEVVATGDTTLKSVETGTFTIANPPSVAFLTPAPAAVMYPDSSYTISWSDNYLDTVTLQYSLADNTGSFSKFIPIASNTTATSVSWQVPDTIKYSKEVDFQLVPTKTEAAPAVNVIDTIKVQNVLPNGVVENGMAPTGLAISNVYPNPASNGQEMVVEYTNATPSPVSLTMLDLMGHQVGFYTTSSGTVRLSTSSLEAGAYILRLTDGTNVVSKRVEVIR